MERGSKEGADAVVGDGSFFIDAAQVSRARRESGATILAFLAALVEPTRALASAPISRFRVGAVALGRSGCAYGGVNVEFPGLPLHHSVHAEQFLVANAARKGERCFTHLAVSAAPCGHCRQFLQELRGSGDIQVLIVDSHAETQALSQFLPHRFGPHDLLDVEFPLMLEPRDNGLGFNSQNPLPAYVSSVVTAQPHSLFDLAAWLTEKSASSSDGNNGQKDSEISWTLSAAQESAASSVSGKICNGFLDESSCLNYQATPKLACQNGLCSREEIICVDGEEVICQKLDKLRVSALRAANCSYAPYTNCPSGLSFLTHEGKLFSGSYLESAAYNPSLSPLQAAVISFISQGGRRYEDIVHAVLVEKTGAAVQQADTVRLALNKISPRCSFLVYSVSCLHEK